jgi:predicted CoA-binding protein
MYNFSVIFIFYNQELFNLGQIMKNSVQDFINCRRIAVIGFSCSGRKFGNSAYHELTKRGYEVFAVHPSVQEISGIKCFPDLSSLKSKADAVLISIPPAQVLKVFDDLKNSGINNVWLQKGAESDEVMQAFSQTELNVISGKCILMYAPPVRSVHALHRCIVKFFGSL